MIDPKASVNKRVRISKTVLLIVAVLAALLPNKPADILFLVSVKPFVIGFFPALILGIFWKRTTNLGVSLGMLTESRYLYYMAINQPWLRELIFNIPKEAPITDIWFGIDPISAGILCPCWFPGNGLSFFGYKVTIERKYRSP